MTEPAAQTGTRVRDHLANERTFLAWVRSSVSLMGFGVLIARLRYFFAAPGASLPASGSPPRSSLLGLAFVVVGLVSLLFATANYARTRRGIETGTYEPLGTAIYIISIVIFTLGAASVAYLIALTGHA